MNNIKSKDFYPVSVQMDKPMIDLTDPKIALIHGALINVLGNRNVTKIPDYFTEDVIVIINEKYLQGPEFYNRIQWLRDNPEIKSVNVTVHNAFFTGDQGFDHQTPRLFIRMENRLLIKFLAI